MKNILIIFIVSTLYSIDAAPSPAKEVTKYAFGSIPERLTGARVFKGIEAKKNQFPHQVALQIDLTSFCGGSLIHPQWVLTSANCVNSATTVTAILGSVDGIVGEISLLASEIIVHPAFDALSLAHDIALIKLESEVVIPKNKSIKVIKLQQRTKTCTAAPAKQLLISGWGYVNTSVSSIPKVLQYATLEELTNEKCFESYGVKGVQPTVMCARGLNSESSCKGDNGGALITPGNSPTQFGIVSFGKDCGDGEPTGYTRVGLYIDWLQLETKVTFK